MIHVGEAILITSYYPIVDISIYFRPYLNKFSIELANGGRDEARSITPDTPFWRDIEISRVSATCIWDAGLIQGLPEAPVDFVTLDQISIIAPVGLHINYAIHVRTHEIDIHAKHGPSLVVGQGADVQAHIL
jgi:hypothetical protein